MIYDIIGFGLSHPAHEDVYLINVSHRWLCMQRFLALGVLFSMIEKGDINVIGTQ
jgi:hypothetical protein